MDPACTPPTANDLFSLEAGTTAGRPVELDLETAPREPGRQGPGLPPALQGWDHFEVRGFLGQGGMGRVYEGWDLHLRRKVALKFLHGHLPGEAARMLREGRAQALIDHPHVVKIFEAGEAGGQSYLAMQFVPGKSLQDLIPDLPMAERLRVLVQACYGVHAAHRKGLLHRDLKPANILVEVREDGRCHAFVSDFGMARTETSEETAAGGFEGTPAFMSPEQIRKRTLDARSDVYGLGGCLYMLLTGRPPFTAPQFLDLMQQALEVPPLAPRVWIPDLPRDLEAIALRSLAKDPAQRYPSAKALAEDLECYLAGRPVQARPATLYTRMQKWVGRNPMSVASALAILVLFSAGMTFQAVRIARERTRANQEAEMARSSLAFLKGVFEQVRPSGKQGPTITVKELLDHGRGQLDGLGDKPILQAELQEMLGDLYVSFGMYDAALPLEEQARQTFERLRGPGHLDVARSLSNLAVLDSMLARYGEAERLQRRALAIREQALGAGHPDVADSLGKLAAVLNEEGHAQGAEQLYKRALAIREKALGQNALAVAANLNGLAVVYYGQGSYSEAEKLYKQALAIEEKNLGLDHPTLAAHLNNLANVYYNLGQYPEAETQHKRALAIEEKILGLDHPDVAMSLENLAIIRDALGDYPEAVRLHLRALAIQDKTLGPDHPDVARSLMNLANVYVSLGKFAEAERMHMRALAIWEKTLGPDHPNVAISLYNLAVLYQKMGRTSGIEPLRKRSIAILDKAFGSPGKWPADAQIKFAVLETLLGHRDEALQRIGRALDAGYRDPALATTKEFAALHGDPRFQKLVAGMKNRPAAS